ncbi:MAG: hypothetical protein DCC58_04160 [Chloroflexi bacterium]|nr:MAG: hypothetical protein DCC58_04160 [Chloroflexota bacterium]
MSAPDWFSVIPATPRVTIIREPLGDDDVKSYLVEGDDAVAVLDTGMGVGDFAGLVRRLSSRPPIVLHSHSHWDHIGASHTFEQVLIHQAEADDLRRGVAFSDYSSWFTPEFVAAHPLPAEFDPATAGIPGCEPTGFLQHGDVIDLGGRRLEVFHTPGHSPGGITLLDRANRLLFPGDAVNYGPLYLFLDGCDLAAYRDMLNLLVELARDVDAIYPSHDAWPMDPADVVVARDAYESVLAGRPADEQHPPQGGYAGYDIHAIGRFRFLMPAGYAGMA